MGKRPLTFLPENDEEALELAVEKILEAANMLCSAADMADQTEWETVEHYVNTAIRLRDIANALSPDRPEWPANVIPFVPRQA